MTDLDLFALMRDVVMTATGVPECILGRGDMKSPAGAYASIVVNQSVTQRGQANVNRRTLPGQLVEVDVRAQVIAECSIQFYRTGAKGNARRMLQCNKRPDISAKLFQAGVGWNRAGAVNDLSMLQAASEHEERAQVSVFVMYEITDPVEINSIESAGIVVENEDGDTLESVTVPSTAV